MQMIDEFPTVLMYHYLPFAVNMCGMYMKGSEVDANYNNRFMCEFLEVYL